MFCFIPYLVRGRGYEIGPVCLAVCVCLLFSTLKVKLFGIRNLKFGVRIDLDKTSDGFEVQGHRSRSPH